jgi:hypothetical protein
VVVAIRAAAGTSVTLCESTPAHAFFYDHPSCVLPRCRGDKSFFAVAAVGGAALLGALYLFLQSQTQL